MRGSSSGGRRRAHGREVVEIGAVVERTHAGEAAGERTARRRLAPQRAATVASVAGGGGADGRRVLEGGRDESQALLVGLDRLERVEQVVAHLAHHHRLLVDLLDMVGLDAELLIGALSARVAAAAAAADGATGGAARATAHQRRARAAERGEYDRVRRRHVVQQREILQFEIDRDTQRKLHFLLLLKQMIDRSHTHKWRGGHLNDGADAFGELAQLVEVDEAFDGRLAELVDAVEVLLGDGEKGYLFVVVVVVVVISFEQRINYVYSQKEFAAYNWRLDEFALDHLAILEHVEGGIEE